MWWNRSRRADIVPEQLLNSTAVAARIGRNRSRVHQMATAGQLPVPDAQLQDGGSLWRAETIDSWWVAAGRQLPGDDQPRYYRPVPDPAPARRPLEALLEVPARGHRVSAHVRVHDGVDHGGAVVVVSLLDASHVRLPAAVDALQHLRRRHELAETDGDTLWVLYNQDDHDDDGWPSPELLDVTELMPLAAAGHLHAGVTAPRITTADLQRLTGQPLEVYPADLYRHDVVAQRLAATAGRGDLLLAPTPVVTDPEGLGQLVHHLRVVDYAITGPAQPAHDDDHADARGLRAAAGVLVEQVDAVSRRYQSDQDFALEVPRRSAAPDGTYAAVLGQARVLNGAERQLVQIYHRPTPLRASSWQDTPPRLVHTVAGDAWDVLAAVRAEVSAYPGHDDPELRAALTHAEAYANTQLDSDPRFVDQEARPFTASFTQTGDLMAEYLATLRHLEEKDESSDPWRRRITALVGEHRPHEEWARQVWLDERHERLLVTFEELHPRQRSWHDDRPLRPVRDLHVEHPRTLPARAVDASCRIQGDPGHSGPRPVWIRYPDGQLDLLPEKTKVGMTWGYSGTGPGNLSAAIRRVLSVGREDLDWSTELIWRELIYPDICVVPSQDGPLDLDVSALLAARDTAIQRACETDQSS